MSRIRIAHAATSAAKTLIARFMEGIGMKSNSKQTSVGTKPRSRLTKVGTDEEVSEVMRLRLIRGHTPSQIAKRLKIAPDRVQELLIAATYYGLGLADGRGSK
jgi:hypothetical protein